MSHLRRIPTLAALAFAWLPAAAARGQHSSVVESVHNLSVAGPGEVRAQDETQVCKFCHIPHNAIVSEPLWGHSLSTAARYDTPRLQRGRVTESSPQPDGSSRLCLSCHDGTVAVGELARSRVPMLGKNRLGVGSLGTDLSGSHPVSVRIPESGVDRSDGADMGVRPRSAIQDDESIRLDAEGKVQCTTCHNPHSDRYYEEGKVPRFWVRPTVNEVCLKCHEVR